MEDVKVNLDVQSLKVVATKKGHDGFRRIDEGVVFELKEKEGLDRDGNKRIFTVKDQFSNKWMKPYIGKKVNITVEGDFDEDEEEVVIVKKDKKKKNKDQVSDSKQEVI